MIPTSIDGTDITGATIDGTDVTEITVDGQTVFSATQLPVRYSDMVGWWPFDAVEYGGSNADDVTAKIPGAGYSTALDGTEQGGISHLSSGGVTDINAGLSSGAYSFDGSDDAIDLDNVNFNNETITGTTTCWYDANATNSNTMLDPRNGTSAAWFTRLNGGNNQFDIDHSGGRTTLTHPASTNTLTFFAATWTNNGTAELYTAESTDSSVVQRDSGTVGTVNTNSGLFEGYIGSYQGDRRMFDGVIDDVRMYSASLPQSDIQAIFDNTKP